MRFDLCKSYVDESERTNYHCFGCAKKSQKRKKAIT